MPKQLTEINPKTGKPVRHRPRPLIKDKYFHPFFNRDDVMLAALRKAIECTDDRDKRKAYSRVYQQITGKIYI